MPKIKPVKIKSPKIAKMKYTKKGERGLTSSDRKKEIEKVKRRCQKCKRVFDIHKLDVHHKKSVASYKGKGIQRDIGYFEYYTNKRKKQAHDRSKNLLVLCKNCHADVHKEESDKRKSKNKKKRSSNPFSINYGF